MTPYEIGRLMAEPVLPPLYRQVRTRLRGLVKEFDRPPQMLDVGGRKSPYTIGLQAAITVIDLPRRSEVQKSLNLGVNDEIIDQIKNRRSNVESVVLGDMTNSDLPDDVYDIVVSVEVLEHVEEDERFVSEVCRVLKPGGIFLMTTPNGDWVENRNPDHKRHYKRNDLRGLLERHLDDVAVEYAIAGGRCRSMGLRSWSISNPSRTALSAFGNLVNSIQSSGKGIRQQSRGTHHLIAAGVKAHVRW